MNFDELKEGMRVKWGESEGRIVKLYPHYAWAESKNTSHVPENLYIDRENVQYIVSVEPEKGHKFETGMRVKYMHQLGTGETVGKDCCFVRFDNAWGGLPCFFENEMMNELQIVEAEKEEIENIPQTSPSYYDVGGISVNDVIRAKLTSEDLVLRSMICGQRETYFIGRYVQGLNSKGKVTEGFSCPGKVTHWALLEKVQTD